MHTLQVMNRAAADGMPAPHLARRSMSLLATMVQPLVDAAPHVAANLRLTVLPSLWHGISRTRFHVSTLNKLRSGPDCLTVGPHMTLARLLIALTLCLFCAALVHKLEDCLNAEGGYQWPLYCDSVRVRAKQLGFVMRLHLHKWAFVRLPKRA